MVTAYTAGDLKPVLMKGVRTGGKNPVCMNRGYWSCKEMMRGERQITTE